MTQKMVQQIRIFIKILLCLNFFNLPILIIEVIEFFDVWTNFSIYYIINT